MARMSDEHERFAVIRDHDVPEQEVDGLSDHTVRLELQDLGALGRVQAELLQRLPSDHPLEQGPGVNGLFRMVATPGEQGLSFFDGSQGRVHWAPQGDCYLAPLPNITL